MYSQRRSTGRRGIPRSSLGRPLVAVLLETEVSASGVETSVAVSGSGPATAGPHACPFRGRAWNGCPRPMRRSWLRRNRLKPFGDPMGAEGLSCLGALSPHFFGEASERRPWAYKTRRQPGRFCPAFLMECWLMARTRPFAAAPRCPAHASAVWEPPLGFRSAADRTVPSVVARSAGAASPGPAIDNAAPTPAVVAA